MISERDVDAAASRRRDAVLQLLLRYAQHHDLADMRSATSGWVLKLLPLAPASGIEAIDILTGRL